MTTRVEIKRKNSENALSVLRKFTRKVRNAGFILDLKKRRYFKRKDSTLRTKDSALNRLQKQQEFRELYKMGKEEKK